MLNKLPHLQILQRHPPVALDKKQKISAVLQGAVDDTGNARERRFPSCKSFSKTGSNAFIEMRTCKKCGWAQKNKKTIELANPGTCAHPNVDRRGSTQPAQPARIVAQCLMNCRRKSERLERLQLP